MSQIEADTLPILPTQAVIDAINEGQLLRGWITNAYAQIEFMLGDLIVRSRQFPIYRDINGNLPHRVTKRIEAVRQLLAADGPLRPYAGRLSVVIGRFERGHETRNLLAHGFCEYLFTTDGDAGLQFQKWHRQAGGSDRDDLRQIRCFRLSDMRAEKESFSELAQQAMKLFKEIHDQFGWTGRPDS